jgi:hypothetical protein
MNVVSSPPTVVRLDAQDRITSASEDWLQYAPASGREPKEGALVGRSFFDFSPDPACVALYELVFRRARRTWQPIRVPFTWESPSERRHLELEVVALEGGGLECRYHTILVETREPVASHLPRPPKQLLTLCGWCKKVRLPEGNWVEVEAAAQHLEFFFGEAPRLTHGICQPCRAALWGSFAAARPK